MNIMPTRAFKRAAIVIVIGVAPLALAAQIPTDAWPTYNGDYSGKRYSALTQITPANVTNLEQQWVLQAQVFGAENQRNVATMARASRQEHES